MRALTFFALRGSERGRYIPQKSARGKTLRLPWPHYGLTFNFCRNPQCAQFGTPPDPFDGRGHSKNVTTNFLRGQVSGSGDDKSFICDACGVSAVIKNNRSIIEEYRRLRKLQQELPDGQSCSKDGCRNHNLIFHKHPDRYKKFGKTCAGNQRFACKACGSTFTVGHPTRNQKLSHHNGTILRLLVNGMPIAKISEIVGMSQRDVYKKIDFIHDCVRRFASRREGDLSQVDWKTVGRTFATDSQTLMLNWPNKKTRASVAVQHLCTAHASSGFIVLAHLQVDPTVKMKDLEQAFMACGDNNFDRCFRDHGRLWLPDEFKAYIDAITRSVQLHPEVAPEVHLGLQLPHEGCLVRQDIQQYAHALAIRRMTAKDKNTRFFYVQDADAGLSRAFIAVFAPEVSEGRADIAPVVFDKYLVNDVREMLAFAGRKLLRTELGLNEEEIDLVPTKFLHHVIDKLIEPRLLGTAIGQPFVWPYHTKSEPNRTIDLLTDRPTLMNDRRARLMRLATLRSVDSYFHKVRSNVRAAFRPSATPSGNGRTWDRYYLYKPEMLEKIMTIYRFHHNWMGSRKTKTTPAMKIGLAKGEDLRAGSIRGVAAFPFQPVKKKVG